MGDEQHHSEFEKEYSDSNFWDKVKNFAVTAGAAVLKPALTLYYTAQDDDTPTWAKTVIYGALGYFISLVDGIPDLTPMIGFSDDLGVLVAAMATIAGNIKEEHKQQAEEKMKQWFGDSQDSPAERPD